jgi:SnoaL-like domain
VAVAQHAVDKLIAEDFTITSGGVDIHSHAKFKKWVSAFLSSINDFRFEVIETFQNEDGSRIASRWRVAGKNNGFMGSEPCQTPFTMVSTAVREVREDGLLQHNWVERNAFEVNRYLREQQTDSCRSSVQPTGLDQAGFGFAIVGSCPRSSPTSSARTGRRKPQLASQLGRTQ